MKFLFISEERTLLEDHILYDGNSSSQSSIPSLVKMSTTLINPMDIPITSDPLPSSLFNSPLSEIEPMPIISDIDSPSSHIYRLNYFSSNTHPQNLNSLEKSLRFSCLAVCRRDEFEQHCLIHLHVDCILNTFLTQQCPKSQYGCPFQYQHLEACQKNGEPMRIRFDEKNDAIAFESYPTIAEATNENSSFLDLPSEILEKILLKLDSLSLRNISLVCRVRNLLFSFDRESLWIV